MDIVNEKKPYKWIDKEISLALINIKLMITMSLQDWLNLTLDELAIPLLLATLITVLLDTLIAIPLATLIAASATPATPPRPTPIAVLLATLIAAPITPTTFFSPQSSNYN